MNNNKCKTDIRIIHSFLNSTGGNWRNSFFIECNVCKYEKCNLCADFLYAPAYDGTPLLVLSRDAEIIFGRRIDKSECLGVISNVKFEALFALFMKTNKSGKPICLLLGAYLNQLKTDEW